MDPLWHTLRNLRNFTKFSTLRKNGARLNSRGRMWTESMLILEVLLGEKKRKSSNRGSTATNRFDVSKSSKSYKILDSSQKYTAAKFGRIYSVGRRISVNRVEINSRSFIRRRKRKNPRIAEPPWFIGSTRRNLRNLSKFSILRENEPSSDVISR